MDKELLILQEWKSIYLSHIDSLHDFLHENNSLCRDYESSKHNFGHQDFNLFHLISDLYYRENFHSDIISAFLDPKGLHHCGNTFLYLFFTLLEQMGKTIDKDNYQDAIVVREEGRIDILIKSVSSKRAIVIENKINNAPDMPRQLPRYYDHLTPEYVIDAIVYIPLDKSKRPDMHDWSIDDREKILQLFVILPAYDMVDYNLVDNWLVPCQHTVNDINLLSTLRQYSSLVKQLNRNIMDTIILEKFYQSLQQDDNMQSAQSIRNMLGDIPSYMALRIQKRFGGDCSPFSKIWIYKSQDAVFEALQLHGYYLKMDIWCYERGYDVVFWAPNNQEEEGFENIVDNIKSLMNFTKKVDASCSYFRQFDFKNEVGLFDFIETLLKELRDLN